MKLKFWGTRGSIPTPQPDAMKYGGETSCIEIWTAEDNLIFLDGGTGIRRAGIELIEKRPDVTEGSIFLSHLHWDHIQGLPFFRPLYDPAYNFTIYGPSRIDRSLEYRLGKQMSELFFPVTLDQIQDNIRFEGIVEEPVFIGKTIVTPRCLNHPEGVFAYRIEDAGKVVVYASDVEQAPGEEIDDDILIIAKGADVLIFDAQYTPEEYLLHRGWGHSTWKEGVRVAKALGIKQLILFHHDPGRSDHQIDVMLEEVRNEFPDTIAASRDMELEV